ncbi:hypothetical protein GCM10009745_59570 [Kribbella yunnanensis]|uniref:Tail specific protease domain-containing protein n=1 Tax=Kribbella yunnanensis TaxID=190194 RepID=A0ABN2IFL4_9ACTN
MFGTNSAGYSSANVKVNLDDGASFLPTTSVYADRTGKRYGGVIRPDVATKPEAPDEAATQWLRNRCS